MGANIVNAMLEGVAELFREWFAEQKDFIQYFK